MASHHDNLDDGGLADLLPVLTSEQLLAMVKLLPVAKPYPTRKADRAGVIIKHLSGDRLRDTWQGLDETQRLAIAESLRDPDRRFRPDRFRAKYGKMPPVLDVGYRQSSPLRLFLYPLARHSYTPEVVPSDLAERLRAFVPEPPGVKIRTRPELPDRVHQPRRGFVRPDTERPSELVELQRHDAEPVALREVMTLLRLVQSGVVKVSTATRRATAASVRRIASVLEGGDFFDPDERKDRSWEQVPGPVRSLAWPLLLQAGRLVSTTGSKLSLTKAGRAALAAPTADVLKDLWCRWVTNSVFDEFARIDDIKGQTRGRGKRSLTPAAERRDMVAAALNRCPVGDWISFDHFSRFMRASSLDFEITDDPWTLYLVESHYGSLGYSGHHDWEVLQGRYVMCVLFEYVATLGLIDIAYTRPENARLDFTGLPNADSLAYLSRYDGPCFFRVNRLGAYCLDLAPSYVPRRPALRTRLSVHPDGRVRAANGSIGHDEVLLLETYADREADAVWRLDRTKMLLAIEDGRDLEELRHFIAERDDQELPETVEGLLRRTATAARALAPVGTAMLYECADGETRMHIIDDRTVMRLCLPAGERHLAVPEKSVEAFRKAVHGMGYGISGTSIAFTAPTRRRPGRKR